MNKATLALKKAGEISAGDLIMTGGSLQEARSVIINDELQVTVFFQYGSNKYDFNQKVLVVLEGDVIR